MIGRDESLPRDVEDSAASEATTAEDTLALDGLPFLGLRFSRWDHESHYSVPPKLVVRLNLADLLRKL